MARHNYIRAVAILLVAMAAATLVAVLVGTRSAEAAFPGTNSKIAFASSRVTTGNPTGDREIFAMNPDRTGLEQLTDNTADDGEPAWSDTGRLIAWASYDGTDAEIYVWNYALLVPNQPKRLTTNTALDGSPAFNHDASKIAFTSTQDGDYEIYVMDTADSNPADGNGDNQTNLTNNTSGDDGPAFSPDGTKIAFTSYRDGNAEIYVMNADGTNPVNLTNNAAVDDTAPNWSPDGSKIAFTSTRNDNTDIYVMNADGTDVKRLTKKAAYDYRPAFSPDGKKIAFTSYRGGGDDEIFVMKAKPESRKNRPKNLTNNDVHDSGPDWRPISPP